MLRPVCCVVFHFVNMGHPALWSLPAKALFASSKLTCGRSKHLTRQYKVKQPFPAGKKKGLISLCCGSKKNARHVPCRANVETASEAG